MINNKPAGVNVLYIAQSAVEFALAVSRNTIFIFNSRQT